MTLCKEKSMACHIETSREPDGGWVAKVPALPGLQIYGHSQDETLAIARKLTAILLPKGYPHEPCDQRILVFYPGHRPESTCGVVQGLGIRGSEVQFLAPAFDSTDCGGQ
jgi:hypothetical protein